MNKQEQLIKYVEKKIEFCQNKQKVSTSENAKIWFDGRIFALKQIIIEFDLFEAFSLFFGAIMLFKPF